MIEQAKRQRDIPRWLSISAFVFAVLGLAGIAVIEIGNCQNVNWLSYVLIALIYIPIQIVTEGILSSYLESSKWVVKLVPIILLVAFYTVLVLFKSN